MKEFGSALKDHSNKILDQDKPYGEAQGPKNLKITPAKDTSFDENLEEDENDSSVNEPSSSKIRKKHRPLNMNSAQQLNIHSSDIRDGSDDEGNYLKQA